MVKEADEKALKTLQKYCSRRKYTKNTVDRWMEIATEYLLFLEGNDRTVDDVGDLLNSEGKVVRREEFGVKEFLDTKTAFSARYLNYLCHVLKRLYTAWEKNFPIPSEEFPKVSKEPVRLVLTSEQMLKMAEGAKQMWLERVAKNLDDLCGLRDYCMVLISIDCGARRYQISQLNVEHFDEKKGTLFVPSAKGGRDTIRVLSKMTRSALVYYMKKRSRLQITEKALFLLDNNRGRISLARMSAQFVRISKRVGVYQKGVGFHSARRGKTIRLAEGGLREDEINDVMGWKTGSRMSHTYITMDQSVVQEKAAKVDTLLEKSSKKKTT